MPAIPCSQPVPGRFAMQTTSRLLDDLAKVANGAVSALVGVREEIDALVRQRIERLAADLDLVSREEFEAVKATAANARAEQEKLEKRVAELEAALKKKPATRRPASKSAAK